jgi:FkbM family methyltransferase
MTLSFLQNARALSKVEASVGKKAAMAFILSHSDSVDEFLKCFQKDEVSSRRLSEHLFLMSEKVLSLNVRPDNISFHEGSHNYKFNLILARDPGKAPFVHDLYPLVDVFSLRFYDYFDFKDGTVLDIGGYIGDTATYFAIKGAKSVIVYEPNPINFSYLVQNIQLNGVQNRVEAHKAGLSSHRRKLMVPPTMSGGGSMFYPQEGGTSLGDVEVASPKEALGGLDRVDLLKVDCKGCEQDLIKDAFDEICAKVENIIMEVRNPSDPQTGEMLSKLKVGGFSLRKVNSVYGMVYLSR